MTVNFLYEKRKPIRTLGEGLERKDNRIESQDGVRSKGKDLHGSLYKNIADTESLDSLSLLGLKKRKKNNQEIVLESLSLLLRTEKLESMKRIRAMRETKEGLERKFYRPTRRMLGIRNGFFARPATMGLFIVLNKINETLQDAPGSTISSTDTQS